MANALAHEQSPYLIQHAENPVDWLPWGEEAFRKAREEAKPIFLSIGYSTCHWCHVMERESFENEGIADILNSHFVSIKVDREERPDVDLTYMYFVQATSGHGGWPLSVFLTPEREPFFGGTYFPPEGSGGRVGFASLLRRIAELWESKKDDVCEQASELTGRLRKAALAAPAGDSAQDWNAIAAAAVDGFADRFDPKHGGFGGAPKFPRPMGPRALFLFGSCQGIDSGQREAARRMALETLDAIERGGIHDHLGGGYHRYAVDAYWHISHYEKMLYDQAQLLECFVDALQLTGEERWARAVEDIVTYVLRDMRHSDGGFYSAEDADSLGPDGHKSEGAFYIWKANELARKLDDPCDFALFAAAYGVEENGNTRPESDPHGDLSGTNTLYRAQSHEALASAFSMSVDEVDAALERMRGQLRKVREERPRPHLDDKIIVGWNGLMAAGLARAAAVLDRPEWLQAAVDAVGFIKDELWDGERLYRGYRQRRSDIAAFAGDYAALIHALLEIVEAGGDLAWLRWALVLQERQDALFRDPRDGGYFSVREEEGGLFSMKEDSDGAEPAPDSLAAHNLLRLETLLQDRTYGEAAGRLLDARSPAVARQPTAMPWFLAAGVLAAGNRWHVTVSGAETEAGRKVVSTLRRHWHPGSVLQGWPVGEAERSWALRQWPHLKGLATDEVRILACDSHGCREGLEATPFAGCDL